ncbi:MFS transporter [Bifidobacterium lemurum]|uniref:MFS transporter n=1 Tax=Bifidobacterium lemurum TaxID=1603886 RepID=A0A261FW10_9BIFI|nr:MFS transporter [Bifidobacterium lemurum]OZG63384.1 MFS transporter [Bifidobacterium lemurum]QOL34291.1 MFS transporter [Bifidobacterium lemurum]
MTNRNPNSVATKAAVLSISMLLLGSPAINGALPFMQASLGVTASQNEMLSTLPNFAVAIFIVIATWLAGRIGMKRTVFIGLLIVGAAGVVPMFTDDYPVVFASRLALGAGLGMFNALAVGLINELYDGATKSTMLGLRSSAENVGQMALTFLAGVLLNFGWHWSFAIYFLAFPVAAFFWIHVPDDRPAAAVSLSAASTIESAEEVASLHALPPDSAVADKRAERLNPFVWALVLFAIMQMLNNLAVSVRFPAIATAIQGEGYNSSFLLSLLPVLGIVGGCVFGAAKRRIGKAVLYIGLAGYILIDMLISLSDGNFAMVMAGVLLTGFPTTWCFPYVFDALDRIVAPRHRQLATSLVFIGCNIGQFLAPISMSAIAAATGSEAPTAPFPIYGVVFAGILVGVIIHDMRHRNNPDAGHTHLIMD